MFDLTNKDVLVIGGSSGIGLATAVAAARLGARVTVASRNAERVAAAVETIGHQAQGRTLDTLDDAAVTGFFQRGKTYDHVVVTASSTSRGTVAEMPLADAYASLNSKFWGAYRVARAATVADAINPGGSLTFVTGYLAIRPKKGASLQAAINAGLEALAKGLALELAPVRVNAVSPGFVDTPLWGHAPAEEKAARLASVAKGLPAGIAGQGEHLAVQIISGMINPYLTGSVTYVDGGGALV
ncbi:SDR family oxidoreductase [Nitrospirillum viridazoti]|uniref:NAD(P)-dependent dehydrogenase (Short-subunit alcohol dehydrogenase family) n=1 Tax=Nitrospirillum amazonense TaxID=28077 RepID=A0A560IKR8_9PROT|nr:SDR family oxidoreductase [Nitrospirillum amazonense]TWB58649.1 NAD(P)-dependent dehydrogenase (short-subunit alcohol dehydrogenase family) [Nitrospirillum amazonense]